MMKILVFIFFREEMKRGGGGGCGCWEEGLGLGLGLSVEPGMSATHKKERKKARKGMERGV